MATFEWYREGEESWNSIDDLADDAPKRSNAKPGSPRDQKLRLEEIGYLMNVEEYGRAKCLLDEMIPVNDNIEAEHSFQLARCYSSMMFKGYSLKKALKEIRNATRLKPDNEKYWGCEWDILDERRSMRIVYGVMGAIGTIGLSVASGIGYAAYSLIQRYC
jgi:hypothetical protein